MKNLKQIYTKTLSLMTLITCFVVSAASVAADNDARSSLALEVPENFDFSSYQIVDINIVANDEYGTPIEGAIVKIHAVKENGDSNTNNALFIGRTDKSGWLTTTVEFPQHIQDVKVEISSIGYAHSFEHDISVDNRLSNYH